MILDMILRFLEERLDGEKAEPPKEGKTEEAPLADIPPRPLSQPSHNLPPLPEKPEFLDEEAERFLAEVVTPLWAYFNSQGLLEVTYELVRILDEHGSCPSVVQTLKRHDADAALDGKPLSLVSLAEHSYRVACMMVNLYRERTRGRDWELLAPNLVIAGLAHDLGKIPAFRQRYVEKYAMADHPIIGAAVIEEVLASCKTSMPYGLKEAILNHHRSDDQETFLLEYLRKADALAREEEVRIHAERAWIAWEQWFIPKEFLALIAPEINVMRGQSCRIFSFKSIVYASPDLLYSKAQSYAKAKGVVDPAFVSSQNKPLALKRIIGTLRQQGMLSGELPFEYYGMLYQITTKKFFFKLFLTPLKIESFDIYPSVFEERKVGWLKIVASVSPRTPDK